MKHLNWHPVQSPERPHRNRWAVPLGVLLGIGIPLGILITARIRSSQTPAEERAILVDSHFPPESMLDRRQASELLVEAIVQIESQGNPTMVGSVGERGLMQIREGTWKQVTTEHMGTAIPFDRAFEPELNKEVGRYYLGDLQRFLYANREHWQSDLRSLLLACYNAGPDRVRRSGFNLRKLPASVQSYAQRGSALHDFYLSEDAAVLQKLLQQAAGKPPE